MTVRCTMILGDCLEVMPKASDAEVRMIFADFPYGGKTRCDWDTAFDLSKFFSVAKNCGHLKGVMAATATQPFTTKLINSCLDRFRYTLVWNKRVTGSPSVAKFRPLPFHEDVVIFRGKGGVFNPQMTKQPRASVVMTANQNKCRSLSAHMGTAKTEFLGKKYTQKYPSSIIDAGSRTGPIKDRGKHPTQKPVALLDWLIKTYSNHGDTILDPVSGSFTTCVSACLNGRNSVGIEKDPGYFEAGVERVRKTVRDNNLDVKLEVRR